MSLCVRVHAGRVRVAPATLPSPRDSPLPQDGGCGGANGAAADCCATGGDADGDVPAGAVVLVAPAELPPGKYVSLTRSMLLQVPVDCEMPDAQATATLQAQLIGHGVAMAATGSRNAGQSMHGTVSSGVINTGSGLGAASAPGGAGDAPSPLATRSSGFAALGSSMRGAVMRSLVPVRSDDLSMSQMPFLHKAQQAMNARQANTIIKGKRPLSQLGGAAGCSPSCADGSQASLSAGCGSMVDLLPSRGTSAAELRAVRPSCLQSRQPRGGGGGAAGGGGPLSSSSWTELAAATSASAVGAINLRRRSGGNMP